MMLQPQIIEYIIKERLYQDQLWGATDNLNTPYNWAAYIGAYTNRSLIGHPGDSETRKKKFKTDMIKVAALAIAAIEKL